MLFTLLLHRLRVYVSMHPVKLAHLLLRINIFLADRLIYIYLITHMLLINPLTSVYAF